MDLKPIKVSVVKGGAIPLTVPKSAVIDTGGRKIVYVEESQGMFKQKTVMLGHVAKEIAVSFYQCPMHPEIRSDKPGKCPKCGMELELKKIGHGGEYYVVLDKQLKEGDRVATVGNFLLDAQTTVTSGASALYSGATEEKKDK